MGFGFCLAAAFASLVVLCAMTFGATDFVFTRAMYGPWNSSELASFGFDAFYRYFDWTWELYSPGITEERMGKESLEAAKDNVTYVAGQYYQQPMWSMIDFNYSHAVSKSGVVETRTPSPVDDNWWRYMVEEPAIFIANLSVHYPIWGIVWDIELYGHDAFLRTDYSYDEAAMIEFSNATNSTIPRLQTTKRYSWLKNNGLLERYHRWQEEKAYSLAKRTEEAVHAINPSLSLGLLGFEDSWFHWTILRAWNSSTAPVTAWCEKTYGGYKIGGNEGVDHFQRIWKQYGLNGKFLPGFRAGVTSMEAAIRHNGALWIYQYNGHPWQSYGDELKQRYVRMYRAIDSFFYFNTSVARPLPIFDLMPGVEARPYLGPNDTCSVLLKPHGGSAPTNFTILTDVPRIKYMWYKDAPVVYDDCVMTTLEGPNPVLSPDAFPCVISGLRVGDLLPTEVWALLSELQNLRHLYISAGIGLPSGIDEVLLKARGYFESGRYEEARTELLSFRNQTYAFGMDKIRPMVETGFSDPRNSEIPLSILRLFSMAENAFERGDVREGEVLFTEGLLNLSKEVNDAGLLMTVTIIVIFLLRRSPVVGFVPGRAAG